jgi:acetamidase/formamidase
MAEHRLPPDRLHFKWDLDHEPALTIASGDTVLVSTAEVTDDQITPESTAADLLALDAERFYPLCGPIRIEGAAPGQTLAVQVVNIRTGEWGWSAIIPGLGLLPDDFPNPYLCHFDLSGGDKAPFRHDIAIPIEAFLGTMGVCPDGAHRQDVMPPGTFGGNIDTRQLVRGSTLYLPVQADGAMFSCGDGHAAQGDGEVCVTAIECRVEAELRLTLLDRTIPAPQFATPAPHEAGGGFYATTGVGPDLYRGAQDAVRAMIDHLGETYGLLPEDAYVLASLCADLRISEIVDAGQYVVSAFLPLSVFSER